MKFTSVTQEPRNRFKEYQKQLAYEDAWNSHESLMRSITGEANAYRTGFETDEELNKKHYTYPWALAGRDRRKEVF